MRRNLPTLYAFFALTEHGAKAIHYPTDAFSTDMLYRSVRSAVTALNRRLMFHPGSTLEDVTDELTASSMHMTEPFGIPKLIVELHGMPYRENLLMLVPLAVLPENAPE